MTEIIVKRKRGGNYGGSRPISVVRVVGDVVKRAKVFGDPKILIPQIVESEITRLETEKQNLTAQNER